MRSPFENEQDKPDIPAEETEQFFLLQKERSLYHWVFAAISIVVLLNRDRYRKQLARLEI
jgi:hypothetical protein